MKKASRQMALTAFLPLYRLTISGINSVVAYGQVQQYMENLRVVDKLTVRSAHPDRITYEVEVQGGVERLNNILSLSNLLERVDDGYFIDASPGRFDRRSMNDRLSINSASAIEYRYRPPPPPVTGEPDPFRESQPDR